MSPCEKSYKGQREGVDQGEKGNGEGGADGPVFRRK